MNAPEPFVCRACRARGSTADIVCDLGEQPSAKAFPALDAPTPDPVHALAMWLCGACGLAQLVDDTTDEPETRAVEPEALVVQAVEALMAYATQLGTGGTFREFPSPHGGSWFGLLPAGFTPTDGAADLVVDSFGMMHDADQLAAARARAAALAPGGVMLLNYQDLGGIVAGGQTNALRHGHFAYYTLTALVRLLGSVGLVVRSVRTFELYGGTRTLLVTHDGAPDASVRELLAEEDRRQLAVATGVRPLGERVARNADGLREYLVSRRRAGIPVLGYAAASRAVVDLNAAGIDAGLLPAIVDASPAKQGRSLPLGRAGERIAIVGPEALDEHRGDVLLLLPDLADEVLRARPSLKGRLVWADEHGRIGGPSRHVTTFTGSVAVQDRLHRLVPGGAHTYARGSDQYPEFAPPVLRRGLGGLAWDVDDNCYVEYGIGLRAVTLGHADPRVDDAVARAIRGGVNFSRPTLLEADVAERFLSHLPHHDRVKFAKNGSDVTTAAVKLARAATGRAGVLVGDQSFFSVDDWWIGHSPMNAGIPADAYSRVRRFPYGDLGAVEDLLAADEDVACIILQAESATEVPPPGYLEGLRELCDTFGIVLVFDEIITGYRWHRGGIETLRGVHPDLACWAKGIGNGYAIAALTGTAELMDLGGLATDAARPFLLSTTYGPETVGLAALDAVMDVYDTEDPCAVMRARGERLAAGVGEVVAAAGLSDVVGVGGHPACLMFWTKDADGNPSQPFRTLFMQGLLDHGVLGQSFVTCAAHTEGDIDHTIWAVEQSLPDYARGLSDGWEGVLRGRPVAPSNRRYAEPRMRGGA